MISYIFLTVYPNDPAEWPLVLSYEMTRHYALLGPCQPTALELLNKEFPKKTYENGAIRSFHENYYHRKIQSGQFVNRWWLSYSPSQDRIFCITCKLFGLPKAKNSFLAKKGSDDYKNIKRNIEYHESLPEHITSEIARNLYQKNMRIDVKLLETKNREIAENRSILTAVIEAILFCARQNIALRGHCEGYKSSNRGNFLELIKLLSNYHAPLKYHLDKIEQKQHNRVTFLSNVAQNNILNIAAGMVRTVILKQVKKAGQFAVIIDTTTDIANLEQFTFILRYIDEEGKVQERLVALETAPDATGLGMFNVFCNITKKYNINWQTELIAQAYDGAASMQGQYAGLKTRIQNENPRAVYIWCSAHILNLVIVDTCDCCLATKSFFGEIGTLVEFMRARKRTAIFVKWQEILYPNERKCRLKRFSNTRWTSHDRVLIVIQDKYAALLKTLNELSTSHDVDREVISTAKSLIQIITSFQFILVMNFIRKIFSITTEVSNYLQSKSIDFIQAITLVDVTKNRLQDLRSEENCIKIVNSTKSFACENNLEETDFKQRRTKRKKMMPGENMKDEISTSPENIFRIDVYYKVLDSIITSIQVRFEQSRELLKELSLLSPERLMSKNENILNYKFNNLQKWIVNIDETALQTEYITFKQSLNDLLNGHELKFNYFNKDKDTENSEVSSASDDGSSFNNDQKEKDKLTSLKILELLSSYDLIGAFPNLYIAYKSLSTIPISSASAERSFSKVIYI